MQRRLEAEEEQNIKKANKSYDMFAHTRETLKKSMDFFIKEPC